MAAEFREHRNRRRKRGGPSKRLKIGAAIFISTIVLAVGTIGFVQLGPIYFHPKPKPQASDKFIMVASSGVTIINASTNNWTGGTVTLNDQYTQKFGAMATNEVRIIRFRDPKAGRIWFNPQDEKVEKVTVTPDGELPIEWLKPVRR